MSMPSKMPAALAAPPAASPATPVGRLPFRNMSMQDETSFLREASVAAASEKYLEYVQPPSERVIRRFGFFALSWRSWLKLPFSGCSHSSVEPSTEMALEKSIW